MSRHTTIYSKNGRSKVKVVKIGNRNYFANPLVQDFRQRLADVRAMEVRPDDIFIGGMPKSGTHWGYELVNMIMNQTTEISKEMPYHKFPEFVGTPNLTDKMRSLPSPRFIFQHVRLSSESPADIVKVKPKIVYIMRNPKDMFVSSFHYFSLLNNSCGYSGTWEDFFEMSLAGEFPPDTWFDHVLDAERFMEENPEVPVHVLVFEKMKEDLEEEMEKLCHFLGKPTAMAKQIAEVGEFQKFKPAIEKVKMNEVEKKFFVENSQGKFLRKGKVGDWKNLFTVAQSEAFDQLFKTKMAESKLAGIVEPYI